MDNQARFRRIAAISAIISMPLGIGSLIIGSLATDISDAAFDNPASTIGIGAAKAGYAYWSMILDMFGYYLLLLPVALFLWHQLKSKNRALADLATLGGAGYILVGAAGAAILAAVWPPMITGYSTATGDQKQTLEVAFKAITDLVYGGLWNTLEVLLAGMWWLGIGMLLRQERKALGIATIILGAASLLDGIGNITGLAPVANVGLGIYLILAPVWALWVGVAMMKGMEVDNKSYDSRLRRGSGLLSGINQHGGVISTTSGKHWDSTIHR